MTNKQIKHRFFFIFWLSITLLWGCADPSIPYQNLEGEWRVYQDSLQSIFFIPSSKNLQNHQGRLEKFLFEIELAEKLPGHDVRFDSLQIEVVAASQKYGRWYFDLEKYRVDNFLNVEMDSSLFLERIAKIPAFLQSGKEVLEEENLSNIDRHIAHQIDAYHLLKKKRSAEPARLAIKDFIAFLKSVKNNRPFEIEKIKNSR